MSSSEPSSEIVLCGQTYRRHKNGWLREDQFFPITFDETSVRNFAHLAAALDEIERLRAANKGLLELASMTYVPPPTKIVDFAKAEVGDHACTWEYAEGDAGDYKFETAGDPRQFYDDWEAPVIRKRWMLVEVTELPAGSREG